MLRAKYQLKSTFFHQKTMNFIDFPLFWPSELTYSSRHAYWGASPGAVSAAQKKVEKNVTFCTWLDSFIVEVIISKGDGSAGMLTGEIVTQPEFSSTLEYDRMQ